jgi:integrase
VLGNTTFQHLTVVINGSPEVICHSIYLYEDLVQVPLPVQIRLHPTDPVSSYLSSNTNPLKERFLDAAEAGRLRDYVELHHRDAVCLLIGFLMYTGARRHEVFTAEWQHINLEPNSWYVPVTKNGKPRYVMLNRRAVQIIEYARLLQTQQYIHKPQWLFINPNTHKPYRCVFSKWSRIRAELGLHDVRIHDLRHSFASTLVNNGATLYEVQKLLGHSRSATTERYAHLANHRLQQAVSLIDKAYE